MIPGQPMHFFRFLFMTVLLTFTRITSAQTSLDVQIGWGNEARTGRWVPLFIIASNPHPRNVVLEIYVVRR